MRENNGFVVFYLVVKNYIGSLIIVFILCDIFIEFVFNMNFYK